MLSDSLDRAGLSPYERKLADLHCVTATQLVHLDASATAALRGNQGQHSHAAAMGGRRLLCQSLSHELSPRGVHVCHFVVDGVVNAPDTLGRMLGAERFARLRAELGDAGRLLQPAHVAESYLHVASQHRSVWTNEMDLRPHGETPWYNSQSML